MGAIHICQWDGLETLARGQRVVCRTGRGVELGRVISPCSGHHAEPEGRVLRRTTMEDELLDARLEKHKQRAVLDCQRALAELRSETLLLEVEHLFDGRTLVFHFLGTVDATIQAVVDRLSDVYENRARTGHFAQLVAQGCGPGCGSGEGGCGSGGGCAVCVVRDACGKSVR
jgi:hypothetical protein